MTKLVGQFPFFAVLILAHDKGALSPTFGVFLGMAGGDGGLVSPQVA